VNSEQWEITLVGGSAPSEFTGTVTSTAPFYSSSGARLESSDVVTQDSASMLDMTLSVASGRTDVARFSVSMDAKLCLKGSGAPIYIGESLDDATPVSTPVALNGADACDPVAATTAGAGTEATLAATTRKFNKGHYIALMACCDSAKIMAASLKPGVKGFLKRYRWKELEPSQGNYNFAEIQADLTWAAANGKQLVVMIEDKSFRHRPISPSTRPPTSVAGTP
jgi:hypothetical protein